MPHIALYADPYICSYTYTHIYTDAHIHTHAHTHAHTNKHTHPKKTCSLRWSKYTAVNTHSTPYTCRLVTQGCHGTPDSNRMALSVLLMKPHTGQTLLPAHLALVQVLTKHAIAERRTHTHTHTP
jgi:hypothetical protein